MEKEWKIFILNNLVISSLVFKSSVSTKKVSKMRNKPLRTNFEDNALLFKNFDFNKNSKMKLSKMKNMRLVQ